MKSIKYRTNLADRFYNPLHGLSISQAQAIFDGARSGYYATLQYLYSEIERTDPILLTCVERRVSALAELGWQTATLSHAPDGYRALADEQRAALDELFYSVENLEEAVEHLALGYFRGFSHTSFDGHKFDILQSYNFNRDLATGTWLWNPKGDMQGGTPVPSEELITLTHPRAIDYPAMAIYLRHALADKDWGRFIERYGLPPVVMTRPENTTSEQDELFRASAEALADGASMELPFGTQVNWASEARGANPFAEFIEHQERLIVLLATGGTLTSLAESGTGTLAGSAQMEVWEQIVRRDAVKIGSLLHRRIAVPYLRREFKGLPILAEFTLGKEREITPTEAFELAAKAKSAGYRIDQRELEELSGYSLEVDEAPMMMNRDSRVTVLDSATDNDVWQGRDSATDRASEALAEDFSDIARSIISTDDLGSLYGKLSLPRDSKLADVMEDDMADAFADKYNESVEDEETIENDGTSEGAEKGWETRRKGKREIHDKETKDSYGTRDIEKIKSDPSYNYKRAENVIARLSKDNQGKLDVAWREEIGWIELDVGTKGDLAPDEFGRTHKRGFGLSHIQDKHPELVKLMPKILSEGKVIDDNEKEKLIVLGDKKVIVGRRNGEGKYSVITASYIH